MVIYTGIIIVIINNIWRNNTFYQCWEDNLLVQVCIWYNRHKVNLTGGKEWSFLYTAKCTTLYHSCFRECPPLTLFLWLVNCLSKTLVAFHCSFQQASPNLWTFHYVVTLPLPYFIWTIIVPDCVINTLGKNTCKKETTFCQWFIWIREVIPLFPSLDSCSN